MKYKKLMLVTLLLLAVITIGAVSAAEDATVSDDSDELSQGIDDALTVEGTHEDLAENPSEETIAGDDARDVLSYEASDFNVKINESMDLRYEDASAVTFEVPSGAEGDIWVDTNYTEYILSFDLDRSPLTLDDLEIEEPGKYSIYVYFAYTDDDEITHEISLLNGTINVSKTIMAEDFNCDNVESDEVDPIDDLSDDVFDLYDSPVDGKLIVFVDNKKVYEIPASVADFEEDYIAVTSEDLGIDGKNSTYKITVIFNTTEGEEFTLADFNAYYDISDSQEPYISIYSMNIREQIVPIAYISDDNSVNGTVKIFIDGKEYYNKEFKGTSDYLFIRPGDLEGIDVFDKDFLGNHTVTVKYNNITKESDVTFVFEPYVTIPYDVPVGEVSYIVFNAPGNFSGNVILYNAVYNEAENKGEIGSLISSYAISASASEVPLPVLTKGDHLFYVNYTIDGKSDAGFFGVEAVENSQSLSSTISSTKIGVDDSVTITVTGPKEGWVDFYVDMEHVAVYSLVNGTVKHTFSELTQGSHVISVRYDGDEYNDLYYTKSFTVEVINGSVPKPTDISTVKITLSKNSFTYNGKAQKPTVTLSNGEVLKEGVDYTLQWSSASPINAGAYTVTVTGTGAYTGTLKETFKINKAANPLAIKAKTVKVKFSKLKKKAQNLAVSKVIKFTKNGQGTLTYAKASGNKKITINKKTGKVTIKKGLKKGTYKVKVKVKANGNANYLASAFKTVTFKIKVK